MKIINIGFFIGDSVQNSRDFPFYELISLSNDPYADKMALGLVFNSMFGMSYYDFEKLVMGEISGIRVTAINLYDELIDFRINDNYSDFEIATKIYNVFQNFSNFGSLGTLVKHIRPIVITGELQWNA